jgi:hypothetical protein
MAESAPFALVYADEVKLHLKAIPRKHHSLIREELEDRLSSSVFALFS